jgi:ADP-heptose:LPS heptosyltransferase
MHKVERNMLLPKYLGIDGVTPEVTLTVPESVDEYINKFFLSMGATAPIFAVNPFSSKGSMFKRWDLKRYAELIKKIKSECHANVLILWGPGEEEEAEHLRQMVDSGAFLSCPTNVPQLFALLKKVDMYIGGDTGVMHLAVFADTPVVAIFGPTDVHVNAPYGSGHAIIRKELPCSPCKKKDCKDRRCLEEITVEEVFEAVLGMYKRINNAGDDLLRSMRRVQDST